MVWTWPEILASISLEVSNMLKRNRTIALAGAALALSVFGGTGMAVANAADSSSHSPTTSQVQTTDRGEGAKGAEGDGDQAAQDAACKAAGINSSASNINYDDGTGVCSLDSGNGGDTGN